MHKDIFWVFLRDEEFVSKTINDSNIVLNRFPVNKVRQLAKKMESSKAIPKYIKQVASDPQTAQINLMHHQCTELPPASFKENRRNILRQGKIQASSIITMKKNKEGHQCTRNMEHMQAQKDVRSMVIHNMLRDLDVQLVSTNVEIVIMSF